MMGSGGKPVQIVTSVGCIKLFIPFNEKYYIIVTNMLGKEVHSFIGNIQGWHTIPTKSTNTGVYLLAIMAKGDRATEKIVIMH